MSIKWIKSYVFNEHVCIASVCVLRIFEFSSSQNTWRSHICIESMDDIFVNFEASFLTKEEEQQQHVEN